MNLESMKRKLLVKYPLFGSVVVHSNFISKTSVGTAGTDGTNIYYNSNFMESITDDQQVFIFAHEICHIAFNHIVRSEGKDQNLWNIATDSVINAFLKQDGLSIIEGAVDTPEAIHYDAEEMYQKLLKEKQQNSGQGNDTKNTNLEQQKQNGKGFSNANMESSNHQNSQSQNQKSNLESSSTSSKSEENETCDVGHDTHAMWDKAIEKKHQEEQSSKMQNLNSENEKNEEAKELTKIGEKEAFKQNKLERKKQLEELRKSLASQSHGHGSMTNSETRNITDIGTAKPLFDWRTLLKEAITYDVDWSYQNAGIEDGVVTAYLEEITRPETEIILDTSGSINETLVKNFLRECKNILPTSKVKVGCFDTMFYGFTEIKTLSDIDNLKLYGGGGTNFDTAVNSFTKRVENKIIFTDGQANMPNTSIDAIWIVFGGRKIHPPGGKVIYIDDHQLNQLYHCQIAGEIKGKTK